MKKSTIWILGIIMGLSFLSLLYLQVSYIEEMVKMRKEQFNTSVRNALFQGSKDVEYDEMQRWLLEDITEGTQSTGSVFFYYRTEKRFNSAIGAL